MADQQCRVTVIGAARRADVALPAWTPIGEYISSLTEMCGQADDATFPAAWSLSTAGQAALPPVACLAEAGVTDGQVLYLCDATAGEYDEPVIFEVEELVDDVAGRAAGPPWAGRIRSVTALFAGAGWLIAAVAVMASKPGAGLLGPAVAAALVPALVAWLARRDALGIGRPARVVLALSAIPGLAGAGWLAVRVAHGDLALAVAGLAAGGMAGALAAIIAVPGVLVIAAALLTFASAVTATALAMTRASTAESAATAAVLGYVLLLQAPGLAARLAALRSWLPEPPDATRTVVQAHRLMIGTSVIAGLGAGVALVLAGRSGNIFAFALAGCLSAALVLRAGAFRFAAQAVPSLVAGLAGLFAIAVTGIGELRVSPWLLPAVLAAAGAAGLLTGVVSSVRCLAGRGRPAGTPSRWAQAIVVVCSIAALPLLVGVFGAFGHLVSMGRHL